MQQSFPFSKVLLMRICISLIRNILSLARAILSFMKHTQPKFRFPLTVLLFLFLLSMFSCTSGSEGKLIGTWKGSDFLFIKTEGPDLVVTINGGLEQHLNSKLIFKEEGTYEKLVGEYDNGNGTWIVEDGQLITTGENGNVLIYKLLKVTDDELITSHDVSLDTPEGEIKGKITLSYTKE